MWFLVHAALHGKGSCCPHTHFTHTCAQRDCRLLGTLWEVPGLARVGSLLFLSTSGTGSFVLWENLFIYSALHKACSLRASHTHVYPIKPRPFLRYLITFCLAILASLGAGLSSPFPPVPCLALSNQVGSQPFHTNEWRHREE